MSPSQLIVTGEYAANKLRGLWATSSEINVCLGEGSRVCRSMCNAMLVMCPCYPCLLPPVKGFSTFSATVLALTFVFGNSVKNMYESSESLRARAPGAGWLPVIGAPTRVPQHGLDGCVTGLW